MFQKILADAEDSAVEANPSCDASTAVDVQSDTALQCLVKVAAYHGVDLSFQGQSETFEDAVNSTAAETGRVWLTPNAWLGAPAAADLGYMRGDGLEGFRA
jgi:hypothetical protein